MTKPHVLSGVDDKILIALGEYRLLTQAQMLRLRISDRKSIGERLSRLSIAGYVDNVRGSAQSPGVYWLTTKAAKHFAERFGETWARAASAKGFADGAHMTQRLATVDVCIALRTWLNETGGNLVSLRTDFEAAENLKRATTLEWNGVRYTPDALAEITDANAAPWAFAIEVETGGFQNRIDNFTQRLEHRLDVMRKRCMDYALNRPPGSRAARMLFVFASADMLARALKTLPATAARELEAVYFKTLPETVENFGGDWMQANGKRRDPFKAVAQ